MRARCRVIHQDVGRQAPAWPIRRNAHAGTAVISALVIFVSAFLFGLWCGWMGRGSAVSKTARLRGHDEDKRHSPDCREKDQLS